MKTWRIVLLATALASLAAVGVVVAFGGDGGGSPSSTTSTTNGLDVRPRDAADDVFTKSLVTFEGASVPLDQALKPGVPTVINFFASTCTPCITEMPALEKVHQKLGDKVQVLGLAMRDDKDDALGIVRQTGVTYDVAQDIDGSLLQGFGGVVMPTTVFVDGNLKVVDVRSKKLKESEFLETIADKLGVTA